MKHSRSIFLAGAVGLTTLFGGCVVAPATYPGYDYGYGYGYAPAVVAPAPMVVAPPVSVGIGIGGYYSSGRGYWHGRGGPGRWAYRR